MTNHVLRAAFARPETTQNTPTFLADESATIVGNHAHVLNPIAERTALIGLDGAAGELVEALTTDQRLALGKLASIMRSNVSAD